VSSVYILFRIAGLTLRSNGPECDSLHIDVPIYCARKRKRFCRRTTPWKCVRESGTWVCYWSDRPTKRHIV